MPLSFLYPLFWLGALAVAAPLWLHLRRKRETNLMQFSAVRFLDDLPTPRRSSCQIRDWLLFAVRVMALLLLVAAFAWPYWRKRRTVSIQESRVYVLDNTMSRQANDSFARDRDRLAEEFGRMNGGVQAAVVELTLAPRVLIGFGEDHETARQKLVQLRPSHQRGSYLAAFRQANALLENAIGERKRVIFLGDNQENQWNENVNVPPFLRQVEVELPNAGPAQLPNLSLSEPRVQRMFAGDRSRVNFSVKLSHQGPAASANVTLQADGRQVFNRTVDLKGQPQTLLLQGQWEADAKTWVTGEATVDGAPDALGADNRVFFSLAPVVEGKVALLAQSVYLRLALSPEVMRGQWAARVLSPERLAEELTTMELADVLCIESGYLQSAEARKLVQRYLSEKRGVLLVVNRMSPAIKECMHELGFEAEGMVTCQQDKPERFQFLLSNHPIFHPFISPDFGNLLEITVSEFARLRAPEAMPLIFGDNRTGLLFQSSKFPGRLFVVAFGLDREHSSWPVHPTFIPFLDLTLQAARAADPVPTAFEPGELIQLPVGASAQDVVLRAGQKVVERARVEGGRAPLRLPDEPGLYTVSYDNSAQIERIVSVNPSPKESELVFIDAPGALKAWRVKDQGEVLRAGVAPIGLREPGILRQRLWWWMVWGALAVLLVEMVLAGVRKERS